MRRYIKAEHLKHCALCADDVPEVDDRCYCPKCQARSDRLKAKLDDLRRKRQAAS